MNFLRRLFARAPDDPAVAAYLAATPRRVPPKTPAAELRFIALDAETTGLDVTKDRMLSLALTEVRAGRLHIASSAAWLVYQPEIALTPATTVHGILPTETAHGRPEIAVMRELLPHLHGAVLVGHHVGFDAAMLDAAMQRHFGRRLVNPVLDTAQLAMEAIDAFGKTGYPGQRMPSLDEVCAQCDLPPMERHTAEGDAFTTATLFLMLCARLQRQLGRPLLASDLGLVVWK